jgi:hypothetical protein
MAILAFDGFDRYSSPSQLSLRTGLLQWHSLFRLTLVTGRGGVGRGIAGVFLTGTLGATLGGNYQTLYYGMWVEATSGSSPTGPITLTIGETATGTCGTFTIDVVNGAVSFTDASGTLRGTSLNNCYNVSAGASLEFMLTVGDTSGHITVRAWGQDILDLGGLHTQPGINEWQNTFLLNFQNNDTAVFVDDFRINDPVPGPGTYPCSSWLGDLRVCTAFPTANFSTQWSPLANTNWQEVSGTTMSDAAYNYPTENGQEDLFSVAPLPATVSVVVALQVSGTYRATDALPHVVTSQIRSRGADHAGTERELSGIYQTFTDLYPVSPITGLSWEVADVSGAQIGYTAVS